MNDQIHNPLRTHTAMAAPTDGPTVRPRKGSWAGVLSIVIGSIVLLALLIGGIWSGVTRGSMASFDFAYSARASERVSLQLDVGDVDIVFDRTDDTAEFIGSGRGAAGKEPITMTNSADGALVIETSRHFVWFGADKRELHGTLHLPRTLNGSVELDLDLDVGRLAIAGDLARLTGSVDVGDLEVQGHVGRADVDVSVGRATFFEGGGTVAAHTDMGELQLHGDFDELQAGTDLGRVRVDGMVRDHLDVSVAAGDAGVTLQGALPSRAHFSADLGSISLTLPDEPFTLDASAGIRDAARSAGLNIDSDADAPAFAIVADLSDVEFALL